KTEEKPKSKLYRASNTRSNDILHTKLEVKFDWQNSWLFGKATIDLKPYFYPTSTLFLDARGMDLFKVQLISNGKASDLKYKYENDSIKIELDKTYTRDDKYTVFIEYKAKPEDLKQGGSNAITSDKGLYFINPKGKDSDKMPQIWTQGETQSSSAWFPTIDSPNERMTEEIYITVDDKYTTLSNGILKDQNKNTDGTRTDHWVMDMPHAPYLVMMGIGEFKIVKDSWKGKDVWYYVEKPYEKYARAIFGNTPEMLEFFSNKLGVQYPWQKYSQIVCRDYVSGAMENTTATLHGEFLYSTDRELLDSDQESVIAHELFHQWFGDLVTCESWSNLPLNESFATYGEYLWNEYKYGRDKADEEGYYSRAGYMAESQRKKTELIRFEYKDKEDMFDAHSYNKGGQILNMLRRYVGDDAFFASLKLYLERNKFNSAEIHNLRLCFEEVTGEDLNWFFNQWFLSKGHPVLKIDRNYDSINKKVILKIVQKQDFEKGTPLFKLPVNVDVYDEGKITRNLIWIKEAEQVFEIVGINSKPDLINFDADKVLLGEIKENKTFDEYVFQYKKAPLYLDRYEALEYLSDKFENPNTYNVLEDATRDKYEGLRKKAISNLSAFATKNEAKLKPIMINLAKFDVNAGVRSEALNFIVNNYNSAFMKDLYLDALKDKSYTVIAYALDGLKTLDKKLALEKARELEKEESTIIMFTLMKTYSENGSDQDLSYFIQNAKNASGFEEVGYYNLFGNFLKNCNDETTINGITFIKNRVKNSGNRYAVFAGRRSILNQKTKYEELESELKSKIEAAKTNNQDPKKLEERLSQVISTKEKIQAIYQEATSE
ncbi:MAG: M1 family metallopeptidase, partial [Bacteroidota bacterium]